GDRRQELPPAAGHRARGGPGPVRARPRVDPVRHPGPLRRRRRPRRGAGLPARPAGPPGLLTGGPPTLGGGGPPRYRGAVTRGLALGVLGWRAWAGVGAAGQEPPKKVDPEVRRRLLERINEARALHKQGKLQEALAPAEEAVALCRKALPPGNQALPASLL